MAVRISRMESSSLVGRRLAATRMRLCAAPAYLARHSPLSSPADLAAHKVIAYSNFATRNEWSFTSPHGEIRVQTRPSVRCNHGDTCRAIALDGGGILLQPSVMLHDDLRRGGFSRSIALSSSASTRYILHASNWRRRSEHSSIIWRSVSARSIGSIDGVGRLG